MKRFNILFVFLMLFWTSKGQNIQEETTETNKTTAQYASFGDQITASESLNAAEMFAAYQEMSGVDSVQVKFTGTVSAVCKAKGCWMKVALEEGQEVMVRFKDYGFFVPKDIEGKEVVLDGLSFVSAMSVEDQQHYAEDAGKSAEEIAAIQTPKKTFGFTADGVLIKQ